MKKSFITILIRNTVEKVHYLNIQFGLKTCELFDKYWTNDILMCVMIRWNKYAHCASRDVASRVRNVFLALEVQISSMLLCQS